MKEIQFLKQNNEKWREFENLLSSNSNQDPDELAKLFIQVTDDLAYSRTFFPDSKTTLYLNQLTRNIHQKIYRNKKESSGRFKKFWLYEIPELFATVRKPMLMSLLIFSVSIIIGAVSTANDDSFVRLILGDRYVNMTLDNIENDDPMAIYKSANEIDMFLGITYNNIRVSFIAFAYGIIFSLGTGFVLFQNGVMLGSFQYFFYEKGLFFESFKTIWIHGTLEISAIVIAGAAGLVLGNSFMFPGTLPRKVAFVNGAKKALKMIIGLIPIFIVAGFLEGFVTRYTEMPVFLSMIIICGSAFFMIYYFVYYPYKLQKRNLTTLADLSSIH